MIPVAELERGKRLNEEHRAFWDSVKPIDAGKPYWEANGGIGLVEHFMRSGLVIKTGSSDAFTVAERGLFVDNALRVYLANKLFVDSSDATKQATLAYFIGGFSSNTHLIVAYDNDLEILIGGCMVQRGSGHHTLKEEIGSPIASLSTDFALDYQAPIDLLQLPIDQVACLMRYHHVMAEKPDRYWGALSREILSAMGRLIGYLDKYQSPLNSSVLDTHALSIIRTMTKYYGAEVIDDKPIVTEHMRAHPLSSHYSKGEPISILRCDTDKIAAASHKIDSELGEKNNLKPEIIYAKRTREYTEVLE